MENQIDLEKLCDPIDQVMANIDRERALEAAEPPKLREQNFRSAEAAYLKWFGFNTGAA